MIIKYATKDVVVFIISNELYFLKFGPDYPQLYNDQLSPLTIPNIDTWLQSKTQQRYSYQTLRDISYAFYMGLSTAYNAEDIDRIRDSIVISTISEIFKNNLVFEYLSAYWIEVLDPDKLKKHINKISINFDIILNRIGPDKLHNELCRMLRSCQQFNQGHDSDVCLSLIKRLGKEPKIPNYPDTTNIDKQILMNVKEIFKQVIGTYYKSVPNNLVEVVHGLQARRL